MGTRSGQAGFTLLELLVVVAVLGALSGVAVVGVNAFDDQAQSSVCAADARAIATAQEAASLGGGAYLDEDALVKAGYLREASTLHDITVAGELYSVDPVGDCVDATTAEPTAKDAAAKVAAEEEAAKDGAAEEKAEAKKKAEEAEARKKAEEAEAKKKAEEEAEKSDATVPPRRPERPQNRVDGQPRR